MARKKKIVQQAEQPRVKQVPMRYFAVDVTNPEVQRFLRLVARAQYLIDKEKLERLAS